MAGDARPGRPRATTHRGRFAPSPTGPLHLGGAATALLAAASARAQGGALVLRIEDLDAPRVVPGSQESIVSDLAWLGVRWEEGPDVGGPAAPYVQSARRRHYDAALAALEARGLLYLCDCSRAEIARVASAPHAGEEGPRYPGTCRPHGLRTRPFRRPPALRLAVPDGEVRVKDGVYGELVEDVARGTGDFVLRRGDGVHAYQLAVVVDDLAMGVTEVVRGADLLRSTPRQALLFRLLGAEPPRYVHLPLVVDAVGERLAKRTRGSTVREHREAGVSPAALISAIAVAYGLARRGDLPGRDPGATLDALAERLAPHRLGTSPVPLASILETLAPVAPRTTP